MESRKCILMFQRKGLISSLSSSTMTFTDVAFDFYIDNDAE